MVYAWRKVYIYSSVILYSLMAQVWSTLKLEKPLTNLIDRVIRERFVYGSLKYNSRSDFARVACIELLKREGIKDLEQQVTKSKRSKKLEVIA